MESKSPRINWFDRWMTAITFAEAGDGKTARDIIGESRRKRNQKRNRREIGSRVDHRPRLRA
jgi:hypothetical protein